MNGLFGQMGTPVPQATPSQVPVMPTPAIATPAIEVPKVDAMPKVQPNQLEAPTEMSRWKDIESQPGFSQGLLAFAATMFQGGDIGTAGLNFLKSIEAATDKEELGKQHETQKRMLAAQQVRENDFKERKMKVDEALAGSTIQNSEATQDIQKGQLTDAQNRTGIRQQSESRQALDSATSRMKDIKTIQKLDVETSKLLAADNAPSDVDLGLWKAAAKLSPGKLDEFGDPMGADVETVLREYNKLSKKPVYLKMDSKAFNEKLEEAVEPTVENPEFGEQFSVELGELYGDAASRRFSTALGKKVAARRKELGVEGSFGKKKSGLFDLMNL